MAGVLLSFAALCALCLFLCGKCGAKGGTAPLAAVCITALYFSLAGVLQQLEAGSFVFFAAALALAVWALVGKESRRRCRALLCPGFLVFCTGSLLLLFYLGARQPIFNEWDEFSTWGTAAKQMVVYDELYTTAPAGWFWTTTQGPTLPALSYFAHFFSRDFAPWKVFWAADVLMLAVGAVFLTPFAAKDWRRALPVGVLALLTPYFFTIFFRQVHLNKTYMSAYVDVPAGMLLGGALVLYFLLRGQKGALWQPCLALAALALTKQPVGLVLALVAGGVMVADTLFFGEAGQKLWRRFAAAGAYFAAVLAPTLIWSCHTDWANGQNLVTGGAETSMPVDEAVLQALGQVTGSAAKNPRFTLALQQLLDAFTATKVSMAGSGLFTFEIIFLLFVAARLFCRDERLKKRMALAFLLLCGGFVAYQFMLLVSYAYIFDYPLEGGLFDYDRYVVTYYMGAFLLGLLFLALCAAKPKKQGAPAARALLAAAWAVLVLFAGMVPPGLSMTDYTQRLYDHERLIQSQAEEVVVALPESARVFFVSQGGDGLTWFKYHYYLLPNILDYSVTGGQSLVWPDEEEGPPAQRLQQYLSENGCDYILITALDADFIDDYGSLFSDGLQQVQSLPALYAKQQDGTYAPVTLEMQQQ